MVNQNLAFVIEDNPNLCSCYAKVLELEGLKTVQIRDGKEALYRLSIETPRLVILDLHLPSVSGVEILEFINHSLHLTHTITVVVSADAVRAETLEQRASLVLVKPIKAETLATLSRRLIDDPLAYR